MARAGVRLVRSSRGIFYAHVGRALPHGAAGGRLLRIGVTSGPPRGTVFCEAPRLEFEAGNQAGTVKGRSG
jgi:hypothetical protein